MRNKKKRICVICGKVFESSHPANWCGCPYKEPIRYWKKKLPETTQLTQTSLLIFFSVEIKRGKGMNSQTNK